LNSLRNAGKAALATGFASLLACAAHGREPEVTGQQQFDIPGYTLIAPDAGRAREVAQWLGEAQSVLSVLLGIEARPAADKTTVLLLSPADLNRYLGDEHVFATQMPQSFSSVMLLPRHEHDSRLKHATYHQATHLFLRNQFHAEIPYWFEEGLAAFMEIADVDGTTAEVGDKRFSFGPPKKDTELLARFQESMYHRERYETEQWFGLQTVLAATAASPEFGVHDAYFMRRQCWLFVHKALMDDATFKAQTFDYLRAVNAFKPIDVAVEQSFGMNIARLDAVLDGYSRREKFATSRLTITPSASPDLGSGTEISTEDMLERLAQLMLDSHARPERIDEVIAAAGRHGLDPTRLHLMRLRAAARQRGGEFDRQLAALEPQLSQPAVARATGLASYERALADTQPKGFERAQDLLGRALAATPGDPQAAWTYGAIAVRNSHDIDGALAQIEAARRSHPDNADLPAMAAMLYFKKNDTEPMMRALQETLRLSRLPEQRRWAARQIAERTAR